MFRNPRPNSARCYHHHLNMIAGGYAVSYHFQQCIKLIHDHCARTTYKVTRSGIRNLTGNLSHIQQTLTFDQIRTFCVSSRLIFDSLGCCFSGAITMNEKRSIVTHHQFQWLQNIFTLYRCVCVMWRRTGEAYSQVNRQTVSSTSSLVGRRLSH